MRFLGLLAFLVFLSGEATAFGFNYKTLAQLAPTEELRAMHATREKIYATAIEVSADTLDDALDARVDGWFRESLTAWQASNLSRRIQSASSFYENPYQLFFAVIAYYEGTGRAAKAIPYLRMARDAAEESLIIGAMIEFQDRLVRNLNAVGLQDVARAEIADFEAGIQELFPCSTDQDPAELDLLTLWLYLKNRNAVLEHELEYDRDLDLEKWKAEFAFLRRAEAHRPALRYVFPGPTIEDPDAFERMVKSKPDNPDYFTSRRIMVFYENYARLFSRFEENTLADQALGRAVEHHQANVARLAFTDEIAASNYAGRFHNTGSLLPLSPKWKKAEERRQRREPFLSRAEQHFVTAEVRLRQGRLDEAMAAVAAARIEQAKVDALFDALGNLERRFANIDRKTIQLDLLEAKVREGLGQTERAIVLYEKHIAAAERLRASVSLDARAHFFRSSARESYFGLLRSHLTNYRRQPSKEHFARIVETSDSFRSRSLRETIQSDEIFTTPTFADLRASLRDGEGVLVLVDLEDRFLSIFFSSSSAEVHTLAKDDRFDDRIFELRNALAKDRQFVVDRFEKLAQRLLGPIASDLSKTSHLYVVTDGAPSALPLEVLPDREGRLLAETTEVTYVPALSLLSDATKTRTNHRVLAVADPVYDEARAIDPSLARATRGSADLNRFPALPETRDESAAIVAMLGGEATALYGHEASESKIKAMPLADFGVIHIATHGILGGEVPTLAEPAIVLSWEEEEDGFLTASEVRRLDLNADLVVLSACNTGNGEYFRGEGLMGMGRAFMEAGARSVLVSLWPVDSFATKELMVSFYRHRMNGESAASALRLAKREFLASGTSASAAGQRGIKVGGGPAPRAFEANDNPYFWSPFILISAASAR